MPTRRGTDYHVLLESAGELRPPEACSLFDFVSFRRLLASTVTNHKNCVCTNMAHFVKNGKTSQDEMGLMLPYVEKFVFLLSVESCQGGYSNPPLSSVVLL